MGFDYRPFENLRFAVGVQDSEAWDVALPDKGFFDPSMGIENSPYKDRWEPYDTYLEIKNLFFSSLTLKVGRQLILYGDERIIGTGSPSNTVAWIWDAAKISYKFKNGFFDVFLGKTVLHEPDRFSLTHRHGFEGAGFYSHVDLPERFFNIALEPFFIAKNDDHDRYKSEDTRSGDFNSFYVGLRSYGNDFKGFDYDLSFVSQRGDFAYDDIEAYGYHFLVAYNFKEIILRPRISLVFNYASGDDDPHDGKQKTFDGVFGQT